MDTTKKLLVFAFYMLLFQLLWAQSKHLTVTGKVVESQSQQPIEFATVMIGDKQTEQTLAGTTTAIDGTFEVKAPSPNFFVEISFIGFLPQKFEGFEIADGKVDLGIVMLSANAEVLNEVVVRGEKSQVEFKLDKRVFHVGKDLSNTGASALEVLNNVPSVNVNIEGEISLRGSSGVQVLINGKPSVLADEEGGALGTITAEMIEKIEVVTNPSAKYDAEGTSGIINIVIKKEERKGVNGSISLNTGVPHNHSIGLSMNRRTEKFNLFSQFGVGYRELPRDRESINTDLVNNTTINSIGTEYRNELFYNVILGTDYHINRYNVLTLSGNFAYEIEDQPSLTNFSIVDETGTTTSEWYRTETTEATNPKWQYELQYKKDFKDHKEHDLLFSALGKFFGKDLTSEFENVATLGSISQADQQTRTNFKEATYTFKLDYTKPIKEKWTMETGAQYVLNDVSNDYEVTEFVTGEWIPDMGLTNVFEYDQKVLGVYGTGAFEDDKWGLKLGLRMENTDLNTLLTNTNEANHQNYTNLFPSAHASYKITDNISIQAGYSRRVRRPRLWDLNPFFNIRNNFSIRTGNPNLLPEFTDSYELNSIYVFEKVSLNAGVYYRYTTDVIERVSFFEDNVNTTRPENIGTNKALGVEFNAKYSATDWLSFNGDVNYNYFNRQGTFDATVFDFNADQWSSKLIAKFKLPAKIDLEITGRYNSKEQTIQGEQTDQLYADMGIRKKIAKGKAVFNFSIRDIFASRVREREIIQEDFYLYNYSQRGQFVTFGFSYGFGKGEAMEYSGRRRR